MRKRQKNSWRFKAKMVEDSEEDNRLAYNERKVRILNLLKEERLTAREIAEREGIDRKTAEALLRRYRINGLVRRKKAPDLNPGRGNSPHVHFLTDQAKENLKEGRIEIKKRSK